MPCPGETTTHTHTTREKTDETNEANELATKRSTNQYINTALETHALLVRRIVMMMMMR